MLFWGVCYVAFASVNRTEWMAEHSIPNLNPELKQLTDEEFPLQARWERWMHSEKYETKGT